MIIHLVPFHLHCSLSLQDTGTRSDKSTSPCLWADSDAARGSDGSKVSGRVGRREMHSFLHAKAMSGLCFQSFFYPPPFPPLTLSMFLTNRSCFLLGGKGEDFRRGRSRELWRKTSRETSREQE